MKKARKLIAVLLTLAMVFAMAVSAFAEETTYKITVKEPEDGWSGHTYEVYQLFAGDYTDGSLTNVELGTGGALTSSYTSVDDAVKALAAIDTTTLSDKEILAEIEKIVTVTNIVTAKITKENPSASVVSGYYLIKDVITEAANDEQTYSLYMVEVVGADVTITPKSGVPTFEKKVKDINDTTDTKESAWQDSADYDIGDMVPFKLEGTVADDYAAYDSYKFVFHDTEEKGLTFDSSTVAVYLDDETNESNKISSEYYTVVTTGLEDGETFEVQFSDLKKIKDVNAGSKIIVVYKSKLNENANLGQPGNKNTASLEFSNNPNTDQGGSTDKTPKDTVIVFTYKVVVNKVDQKGDPLTGAEFTLSKKLQDCTTATVAVVKNNAGTEFTFTGLDDGTYVLHESVTPTGYNSIADITFTVTAAHEITWEGTGDALTSLSGDTTSGAITFTPDKAAGSLTTKVENKKGSTLPETGGIGTTIFYVLGTILVLGAGVVLIARKRVGTK